MDEGSPVASRRPIQESGRQRHALLVKRHEVVRRHDDVDLERPQAGAGLAGLRVPLDVALERESDREIGSFQLFAEPQIFYDIAPDVIGKAYTPNLYVYNLAFADQRLNYAAALSFLLGFVVFVVSYAVMYSSRRQEARR